MRSIALDNYKNGRSEVYSSKIRAGKRTYFFDVKATRSSDYYITITESKRRFQGDGYDKHKIFLYKEDFNKFLTTLTETINYVKTELLPDYDYEEFDREPITSFGEEESTGGQEYSRAADPGDDSYAAVEDDPATTWDD